jgi:hypothetical protein
LDDDKVMVIELWQRVPKVMLTHPVKRQIELIDIDVKHIDPNLKCVAIQGSVSRSVSITDVPKFVNL